MDIELRRSIDLSPPFTAAQAHAEGLGDYDIRRLVQQGRIVRRRRGIYVGATYAKSADADPATSHALDVAALRLAFRSCRNLVAVDTSAAQIHGLEFYKPPPRRIHVVTDDPDAVPLTRDGYMLRWALLPEHDVVEVHDVPVTSPVRTFLDVAADRDFIDGVVLGDSGLHKQIFGKDEVLARLDGLDSRYPPRLREIVAFADARAESALESALRAIFHLHKIPPPLLQVWLLPSVRVDFLWPTFRTVVEADGLVKYLLRGVPHVRQTLDDERARQRAIEAATYAVFRLCWDDLAEPAKLVAGLRETFARGLALLAS